MNWIFLCLIKTFHLCFFLFILFGPYVFNNLNILCILLFLVVLIYYNWYMLKYCIITEIEEYFGEPPRQYEDENKKSFIFELIQTVSGLSDGFY